MATDKLALSIAYDQIYLSMIEDVLTDGTTILNIASQREGWS